MTMYLQPGSIADVLLVEVHQGWTKENGVLLAGSAYVRGEVLAKVAGKYQALDPAATGDAAVPVGVLGDPVDATLADTRGVVIARGAVVNLNALIWPTAITDVQKAAALAELDARGIVARTSF